MSVGSGSDGARRQQAPYDFTCTRICARHCVVQWGDAIAVRYACLDPEVKEIFHGVVVLALECTEQRRPPRCVDAVHGNARCEPFQRRHITVKRGCHPMQLIRRQAR
jgi:hypothetical protein